MFPIKDTIPARSFPIINWCIIAFNSIIFAFQLTLNETELQTLFYVFGLVPARYSHLEWADMVGLRANDYWPFITNTFLHGGWAHFLGNMWTLYIFGDNVEDRMGKARYLIFYLLCGLAASFTHYWVNIDSTVPAIGASGAISGVMAAYMFLFPKSQIIFFFPILFIPYFIELSAFFYIGVWFVGQFISGTFDALFDNQATGIAFWAHIGGFLAGAILFSFFITPSPRKMYEDEFNRRYFEYY
ncbi:MAG: rhomboid family intramembrane serine protease [Bacteroidia bacterium]|nr:rhomboid family intramembrane serine protease [Bacteroidia bacterium]MDW8157891.1 rhomboid family intramembrane serine protease [Bacteroidia bacterium]